MSHWDLNTIAPNLRIAPLLSLRNTNLVGTLGNIMYVYICVCVRVCVLCKFQLKVLTYISYEPKTNLKPNARTRLESKFLRIPNTGIRLVCWKVDSRPTTLVEVMRSWYNNKHPQPLLLQPFGKVANYHQTKLLVVWTIVNKENRKFGTKWTSSW